MKFEGTERNAPAAISCADCGAPLGTVRLPKFGAMMARTLNGGLSVVLDADVDVQAIDPQKIAEAVRLQCAACGVA